MKSISPQFLRQILVVIGLAFCNLSDGFIFGQMSGMVDALGGKDDSIPLSKDELSWIASTINLTCFCGFGFTAILTELFGRRKPITIVCIPLSVCWIMVYFAQDKYTLLVTRLILGASYGGFIILTYLSVGEYVSPEMRSFSLNLMAVFASSFGTLLGHVLSLLMHWRYVALLGLIPTIASAILPFFWIESPAWLATKGRFKECEIAFRKLRSSNEKTELELKMLIDSQREYQNNENKNGNILIELFSKYVNAWKGKPYRKIYALLMVICTYRVAAGRILFSTLIITMLRDITGSSDILLSTLFVDGFSLIGSCIACLFVSKFRMRTLLFTSGPIANLIQITLALCMYLWTDGSVYERWVKVSLLALYCIIISIGPYAVLETLLAELHPLEIGASSLFGIGATSGILQCLGVKVAAHLFPIIGFHGVFFLNAGIIFACMVYLYYFLPETKGRTNQEIQFYFKHNRFANADEMIYPDQQNSLLSREIVDLNNL